MWARYLSMGMHKNKISYSPSEDDIMVIIIKVEKGQVQGKHLDRIICLKLVIHLVIMEM
jgi:hypothetical protein